MYVCVCEGITDKQIKKAIDSGANTVRKLHDELGVASQCGQCGRCAKKILSEHKLSHCDKPALIDSFPILFGPKLATE